MTAPFSPLTLPSGLTLKNRFVKAAMEENLANQYQLPDEALMNLYARWSQGGVGLILTGNVQFVLVNLGTHRVSTNSSDSWQCIETAVCPEHVQALTATVSDQNVVERVASAQ